MYIYIMLHYCALTIEVLPRPKPRSPNPSILANWGVCNAPAAPQQVESASRRGMYLLASNLHIARAKVDGPAAYGFNFIRMNGK